MYILPPTSVALPFIRAHVATACVFFVAARCATLIGLQQMTTAIGAALWVACINRRTAGKQTLSLSRAAIVLKGAELGVGVVQIAWTVEGASIVAAQVVTFRSQTAAIAVPSLRGIGDNTVLQRGRTKVRDTAAEATPFALDRVVADGGVVDRSARSVVVTDTAAVGRI